MVAQRRGAAAAEHDDQQDAVLEEEEAAVVDATDSPSAVATEAESEAAGAVADDDAGSSPDMELAQRALEVLRPLHRPAISLRMRSEERAEPLWTRDRGRGLRGDAPPPRTLEHRVQRHLEEAGRSVHGVVEATGEAAPAA